MYARVITIRPEPNLALDPGHGTRLLGMLGAMPGFEGAYLLQQVALGRAMMLSLWDTEAAATAMGDRLGRPPERESDLVFEVLDDLTGVAAAEPPSVAGVLYFDGPIGRARFDAFRRAHHERVARATARVAGIVRALVLWQPEDAAMTVVNLAVSLETLEDTRQAVQSTELLPGEDPALLPGPDRVEIYRAGPYVPSAAEIPSHAATG